MAFHDTAVFPPEISHGTRGGPSHRNIIQRLPDGRMNVIVTGPGPLMRFDVADRAKQHEHISQVIQFARARRGSGYGFRFLDYFDFSTHPDGFSRVAVDEPTHRHEIGVGDGSKTVFRLSKTYGEEGTQVVRRIEKPMRLSEAQAIGHLYLGSIASGSLHFVFVDGTPQGEGVQYSIDYEIGEIVFSVAPPAASVIEWAGYFFVPARFGPEVDEILDASLDAHNVGSVETLTIIEDPQDFATLALERDPGGATYEVVAEGTTQVLRSMSDGHLHQIDPDAVGTDLPVILPKAHAHLMGRPPMRFVNAGATHNLLLTDRDTSATVLTLQPGQIVSMFLVPDLAGTGMEWIFGP